MFFIASSGRSGSVAVTEGLNSWSDHEVRHEPDPLLREAWLRHHRRPWFTRAYRDRLRLYRSQHRSGALYGESIRTPNLLGAFLRAAPGTPLLVLARDPESYVRSAHSRQVLSKDDQWDRYRLLPRDDDRGDPLAVRIARHWLTVYGYLLDVAERHEPSQVVLFQPIDPVIESWAEFLGVQVTDRESLSAYLSSRPNRSLSSEEPEGFARVEPLCRDMWDRIRRMAV